MVCEQKGAPPRLLESGHAEAFAAIAACEPWLRDMAAELLVMLVPKRGMIPSGYLT